MRKTGSRGILSDMDLSAAGFVFQSKKFSSSSARSPNQ